MTTSVILSLITFIAFCGVFIMAGLMMVASKSLVDTLIIFLAVLIAAFFIYQYDELLFGDLMNYVKLVFDDIKILNK